MRLTIPTIGSYGDVQPYVALGIALRGAGLKVRLATHAAFEGFVRAHGLDFSPIGYDFRALQETEAGQKLLDAGNNAVLFIRRFARLREPLMRRLMADCWQACQDADVIVATTSVFLLALAAAEKRGVPACLASCLPMSPSRFLPNFLLPDPPRWFPAGRLYNLMTHLFVGECFWQLLRSAINRARQEILDLPPLPFLGPSGRLFESLPALYGYSPAVLAKPPDWGATIDVTGYWFLDRPADWQPPARLVDFLGSGPPPVSVGFGSMHSRDAEAITRVVVQALARAGLRGVLLTGWKGLSRTPSSDQVYLAESIPHDWLFPRMAAVVHHGGFGTTAAGLRAGVPSLIIPFMGDHSFWGRRVWALGAGPLPIPRQQLSVERLADALRVAVADAAIRDRAARLGEQIRAENGAARAIEVFQSWYARHEKAAPQAPLARPPVLPAGVASS